MCARPDVFPERAASSKCPLTSAPAGITVWPSTTTSSLTVPVNELPVVAVLVLRSVTRLIPNDVPAGTVIVLGACAVGAGAGEGDLCVVLWLVGAGADAGDEAGGGVYS